MTEDSPITLTGNIAFSKLSENSSDPCVSETHTTHSTPDPSIYQPIHGTQPVSDVSDPTIPERSLQDQLSNDNFIRIHALGSSDSRICNTVIGRNEVPVNQNISNLLTPANYNRTVQRDISVPNSVSLALSNSVAPVECTYKLPIDYTTHDPLPRESFVPTSTTSPRNSTNLSRLSVLESAYQCSIFRPIAQSESSDPIFISPQLLATNKENPSLLRCHLFSSDLSLHQNPVVPSELIYNRNEDDETRNSDHQTECKPVFFGSSRSRVAKKLFLSNENINDAGDSTIPIGVESPSSVPFQSVSDFAVPTIEENTSSLSRQSVSVSHKISELHSSPVLSTSVQLPYRPGQKNASTLWLRQDHSELLKRRPVFDLKNATWPFKNFSASRFFRFPGIALSQSSSTDKIPPVQTALAQNLRENCAIDGLSSNRFFVNDLNNGVGDEWNSIQKTDLTNYNLDTDMTNQCFHRIEPYITREASQVRHTGSLSATDVDGKDIQSDDDAKDESRIDQSQIFAFAPMANTHRLKLPRRRQRKCRIKVQRKEQMAQIQQRDVYERSKKKATQILVNLLDRTEPHGVVPSIHRFQPKPPFIDFGATSPECSSSELSQLQQSSIDELRSSTFQPIDYIPHNLTNEEHEPFLKEYQWITNQNTKIQRTSDSMKEDAFVDSYGESDSDDGDSVSLPWLFLKKKRIEKRDVQNEEDLIGMHETYFTVVELGRYLAVMMYMFGSELIFEILAEVLTCPTVDFRTVSEAQALRRSYLVYEFIATCLGEGDCFFSSNSRPTSCFGMFYPQHDTGRAALNLIRSPMIKKDEIGSWQLHPADATLSENCEWNSRTTTVMNSDLGNTTFNVDEEDEQDFCADEASVDGLTVRHHSSASSVSSGYEGSQGGDGDNFTDLMSLHGSLRILAHVIITEYGLPREILMKIKASVSSSNGKTSRRTFHPYSSLRHHDTNKRSYPNDQEESIKVRKIDQDESIKRISRQINSEENMNPHHQIHKRSERCRRSIYVHRVTNLGKGRPILVRPLRRDYHSSWRVLADDDTTFEFRPPVLLRNVFSLASSSTGRKQQPSTLRLGREGAEEKKVRYNRELLSHKLSATLLRCLLAHKDLLVRILVTGLRDISVRIDSNHGRRHSIHICRLLDMLFSLYEQEVFTSILKQIDGITCLTQAIVLPGVCDFLLRLLSCGVPYVNPTLVTHLDEIEWSRSLTEDLSSAGEQRRIEWSMRRMTQGWRGHFVSKLVHSLGLSPLYYEYCKQLFVQSYQRTEKDSKVGSFSKHNHHAQPDWNPSHFNNFATYGNDPLICFASHIDAVKQSMHFFSAQIDSKYGDSTDKPIASNIMPFIWSDEEFDKFLLKCEEIQVPRLSTVSTRRSSFNEKSYSMISCESCIPHGTPTGDGYEISIQDNRQPTIIKDNSMKETLGTNSSLGSLTDPFDVYCWVSHPSITRILPSAPSIVKDPSIFLTRLLISTLIHFSSKLISGVNNNLIGPSSVYYIPLLSQFAVWCALSDHFKWTGLLMLLVLQHHIYTRTVHYELKTGDGTKSKCRLLTGRCRSNSDPQIMKPCRASEKSFFGNSKLEDQYDSINQQRPILRSRSLSFLNDPMCRSSDDYHAFWKSVRSSRNLLDRMASVSVCSSLCQDSSDLQVSPLPTISPCIYHTHPVASLQQFPTYAEAYKLNEFNRKSISSCYETGSTASPTPSELHNRTPIDTPAPELSSGFTNLQFERLNSKLQFVSQLIGGDQFLPTCPSGRARSLSHVTSDSITDDFVNNEWHSFEAADSSFYQNCKGTKETLQQSVQVEVQLLLRRQSIYYHSMWRIGGMGRLATKTIAQMIGLVGQFALTEFLSKVHPTEISVPSLQCDLKDENYRQLADADMQLNGTRYVDQSKLPNVFQSLYLSPNIYPPVNFSHISEFLMRLLDGASKQQMLFTEPLILDTEPLTQPDCPLYEIPKLKDPIEDPELDESVVPQSVDEKASNVSQLTELQPALDLLKIIFTRKRFFVSLVYALQHAKYKYQAVELLVAFLQQMHPQKPLWRFCLCFSPLFCQYLPNVCEILEQQLNPFFDDQPLSCFSLSLLEVVKVIVELDPCRALVRIPASTWKTLGHAFIHRRDSSILGARCYSIFHRVIEFAGSNLISAVFITSGALDELLKVMAASLSDIPLAGSRDVIPFKEAFGSVMNFALLLQTIYFARRQGDSLDEDDGSSVDDEDELETENEEESSIDNDDQTGQTLGSVLSPTLSLEEIVKFNGNGELENVDLPELALLKTVGEEQIHEKKHINTDENSQQKRVQGGECDNIGVNQHFLRTNSPTQREINDNNNSKSKPSFEELKKIDEWDESFSETNAIEFVEVNDVERRNNEEKNLERIDGKERILALSSISFPIQLGEKDPQELSNTYNCELGDEDWNQADISEELTSEKYLDDDKKMIIHQQSVTTKVVEELINVNDYHKKDDRYYNIDEPLENSETDDDNDKVDKQTEQDDVRFESILSATLSKLVGRVLEVKKQKELGIEIKQGTFSEQHQLNEQDQQHEQQQQQPQLDLISNESYRHEDENDSHWQTLDDSPYKELFYYLDESLLWLQILPGLLRVKANRFARITALSPLEETKKLRDTRKTSERIVQRERTSEQKSIMINDQLRSANLYDSELPFASTILDDCTSTSIRIISDPSLHQTQALPEELTIEISSKYHKSNENGLDDISTVF